MRCKTTVAQIAGACLVVFTYFVLFPEDVSNLTAPITELTVLATTVLNLSYAISPWLYGLLAVAILARAMTQIWGRMSNT